MQTETQFDRVLNTIRPYILEYLQEKGYDTSGAIRCLNPSHEDKKPSMIVSNAEEYGWKVYCRGCGAYYDIFDIYSILENTPRRGPLWWEKTVVPLAGKYRVKLPERELSPEELFFKELYSVYEDVAALIEHDPQKFTGHAKEYTEKKQWTKKTLEELDIGVLSYERLISYISQKDRERFGLNRNDIFCGNKLIFTVRDVYGRVVRFYARNPDDDNANKFASTTAKGLAYNQWKGKGHLYLQHIKSDSSEIILVEGNPDAVTMYQNGIKNARALCGSGGFREEHANNLAMNRILQVVVMFDDDRAGRTATKKLLLGDVIQGGTLKYQVVNLPNGHDPDSYIRNEGIDSFENLLEVGRLSMFDYLLSMQDPEDPPEDICKNLIPVIARIRSEVAREAMSRELAEFLDNAISVGSIMADVQAADTLVLSEKLAKQKSLIIAANKQATYNIPQAREVYRTAIKQLEDIENETGSPKGLKGAFLERVHACKMFDEVTLASGFELSPMGLGSFGKMLEGGNWANSAYIIVGAIQGMGKTSFCNQLVWEIVSNPKNNAIAYIQTLDQPASKVIYRMICHASERTTFTQNMASNPIYYRDVLNDKWAIEMREVAYERFLNLVAEGKIIVEDRKDGSSIAHAETRLRQLRRDNPDANIVWLLDNFHNVSDWETLDPRSKYTLASGYVKDICVSEKVTAICTAEYRKGDPGIPGTDEDLSETRSLKYDPDLTIHLFSDFNAKREDALFVHDNNGVLEPRVVMNIGKNRITEFKGKLAYDFYPAAAQFHHVPKEQANRDLEARKAELEDSKK